MINNNAFFVKFFLCNSNKKSCGVSAALIGIDLWSDLKTQAAPSHRVTKINGNFILPCWNG